MSDLSNFNQEDPAETNRRVDDFVSRCNLVMRDVLYKRYDERQLLTQWLRSLIRETDNPFWVLHEDPLYLTAEYFNLDMASVETGPIANEYLRLARREGWST